MKNVIINQEPVELYKLLKFESLCSSGGEAKAAIADEQVMVNCEIETRKRRKLVAGDIIDFQDVKMKLVLKDADV